MTRVLVVDDPIRRRNMISIVLAYQPIRRVFEASQRRRQQVKLFEESQASTRDRGYFCLQGTIRLRSCRDVAGPGYPACPSSPILGMTALDFFLPEKPPDLVLSVCLAEAVSRPRSDCMRRSKRRSNRNQPSAMPSLAQRGNPSGLS